MKKPIHIDKWKPPAKKSKDKRKAKLAVKKVATGQIIPPCRAQSVKLTESLAAHAVVLDPGLRVKERMVRGLVIEAVEMYKDCEETLGRHFFELRKVYKNQRIWTDIAKILAIGIDKSLRTVTRLIEKHELKIGVRQERTLADSINESGPNPDQRQLSLGEQDTHERRARLRDAVHGYTGEARIGLLEGLISEEAHASWGIHKEFTMIITPRISNNLIMETDDDASTPCVPTDPDDAIDETPSEGLTVIPRVPMNPAEVCPILLN